MQHALGITTKKSVSAIELLVSEETAKVHPKHSDECLGRYICATVKNPGYNPRYPKPFDKYVVIVTPQNLSCWLDNKFTDDPRVEVAILDVGETLKTVELTEQDWKLPNEEDGTLRLLLNISVEGASDRNGEKVGRRIPFVLEKASFGQKG